MSWLSRLRLWAAGDRIRISPREGRLLRVPVGACIRAGGCLGRVTRREVRCSDGRVTIVAYTCQGVAEEFQLRASLTSDVLRLQLMTATMPSRVLDADDVHVYG
jgi:hypothetical protein